MLWSMGDVMANEMELQDQKDMYGRGLNEYWRPFFI